MRRIAFSVVFFCASAYAQIVGLGGVDYVFTAPSGSCAGSAKIQKLVAGAGTAYGCASITNGIGMWAAFASGSATGTVTAVSVTTANGVSGSVATATTTPAITLTLGAITPTSVNGLTFSALATGFSLSGGTTSKTLTLAQTLTLDGTSGSTLNIGAGGTLGTGAFATIANYCALAGCTMSGNLNGNTPTVLGYLNNVTSDLQTQLNAKAASNATTTVNGQSCALAGTCTIPIQTNGVGNTSQAGINLSTSTTNSVGLTVTPVNSGTNVEKFEITGNSYAGNAGTATSLNGCAPSAAGDLCVYTGATWTRVAGNASGTKVFQENASGVGSFASVTAGADFALDNLVAPAINLALTPGTDNAISLDSAAKRYVDGLFSGVVGGTDGAGTKNGGLSFPVGGNEVDVGNGTAGNTGGTLKAAVVNASSSQTVGTAPAIGTSTGTWGCTEGASTGLTPVATADTIRCDATAHGFKLTLNGGSEFTSLMNYALATVPLGGTGLSTLTAHALYAGNGASAPTAIGPDASTTKALFSAGSSADPAFRAIAAADLPVAATVVNSGTITVPSGNAVLVICTSTCSVPVPVPAAGYQICVKNIAGGSTVITLSALGSSAMYPKSDDSGYGTAGTGTMVSSAATGNKVCLIGRDATHYELGAVNASANWTVN